MSDAMNKDETIIKALADYLDESLSQESILRGLLAKVGHNDPNKSIEDCLAGLVADHLRLMVR